MTAVNNDAIRRTLEAGVEFLDENGGLGRASGKQKYRANYNCEQDGRFY
jgi:hypothetical protein